MSQSAHHPIPNLFPDTLELICTNAILNNLTTSGKKVEKEAKWILSNENSFSNFDPQSEDSNFFRTNYFEVCVNMARDFLVSFLASHLLNKLSSTLATPTGNIFERKCFRISEFTSYRVFSFVTRNLAVIAPGNPVKVKKIPPNLILFVHF